MNTSFVEILRNACEEIKSDKVSNYVIAGLDSYLLGKGKVRLFKNSRNHQDSITPHSHRYSVTSIVLQGHVENHIWEACNKHNKQCGDLFQKSVIKPKAEAFSGFTKEEAGRDFYTKVTKIYSAGEVYFMDANTIHSINFSKGAIVLIIEGREVAESSVVLEPVVNGEVIKTLENKDYMFKQH